jgi:DNA-binding SARP family transcriptional activator
MQPLQISIFGKFEARYRDEPIVGLHPTKVQELFCYLLLYRDQPHPRETLASLLWGKYCTTKRSKKYLRNALWRLHTALTTHAQPIAHRLLDVESDWIHLRTIDELRFDAAVFERAYASIIDSPGGEIETETARTLEQAVELYTDDLLVGWYQDWCLYERERFLQMYLIMLDKLAGYCETIQEPERGLSYGDRILQHDRARECTHRQMMRLHYLAGNRTGALRQYQRCVAALKEELNIEPARSTTRLCEQIRNDRLESSSALSVERSFSQSDVQALLVRLHQLENDLVQLRHQFQKTANSAPLKLDDQIISRDTVDESEHA